MDIDLTDVNDIYNAFKRTQGDNSSVHAVASYIARSFKRAKTTAITEFKTQQEAERVEQSLIDGTRLQLSLDCTDAELRLGARAVLIGKLNSGEISAAEFGQFKDIFGLTSQKDHIEVVAASFAGCSGCPKAGHGFGNDAE